MSLAPLDDDERSKVAQDCQHVAAKPAAAATNRCHAGRCSTGWRKAGRLKPVAAKPAAVQPAQAAAAAKSQPAAPRLPRNRCRLPTQSRPPRSRPLQRLSVARSARFAGRRRTAGRSARQSVARRSARRVNSSGKQANGSPSGRAAKERNSKMGLVRFERRGGADWCDHCRRHSDSQQWRCGMAACRKGLSSRARSRRDSETQRLPGSISAASASEPGASLFGHDATAASIRGEDRFRSAIDRGAAGFAGVGGGA